MLLPKTDYGCLKCYYDRDQQKLVLAPDGGDGGKKIGVCADKTAPVASFPAIGPRTILDLYRQGLSGHLIIVTAQTSPFQQFAVQDIARRCAR